jgi:hypothetical protein
MMERNAKRDYVMVVAYYAAAIPVLFTMARFGNGTWGFQRLIGMFQQGVVCGWGGKKLPGAMR